MPYAPAPHDRPVSPRRDGRHPLVIGHRGAPGYRPEHTRSSYELALASGVGAVEPDVVWTKDGVAVVRHENEIGSTTDVSERPEFAARYTSKMIDGVTQSGWFTEDFTWDELSTLRCRERLPALRSTSALHDDTEPPLRLRDVLDLVTASRAARGSDQGVVVEVKHATYFEGLGFDVAGMLAAELREAGWDDAALPLVIESFEQTVLTTLRARGVRARSIFLIEATGRPFDLVTTRGRAAPTYRRLVDAPGLDRLVGEVDGISVDKSMVLAPMLRHPSPARTLVSDAHERGLDVYTWTCRPENAFLARRFRRGRDGAAFGDYEAEWSLIAAAGVDGVFVDHADLGVAFFGGGAADASQA